MSNRPTTLIFNQSPGFLPAGAPLETYEAIADTSCTYEVEASGRLIRKDRIDGTRWLSTDFTGSFTITFVPKYSPTPQMYVLFIVCGVVKHMQAVTLREPTILLSSHWRWVLEAMVVDSDAVAAAKTYRGCLQLISEAEVDRSFKTGDSKLDAMIGMALCRPALLQSKTARNALECLEEYQLRAISSWHRAQLND